MIKKKTLQLTHSYAARPILGEELHRGEATELTQQFLGPPSRKDC